MLWVSSGSSADHESVLRALELSCGFLPPGSVPCVSQPQDLLTSSKMSQVVQAVAYAGSGV